MAIIIEIKTNEKTLVILGAINVSESEFGIPYGKGLQKYEVYKDGKPEGIYITHEFEKGYEALAKKLIDCFESLLTVPK